MTTPRTAVHSVTFCCLPTVNKAVSPCDLSIIFIQLLSEHPVQVIHTTVDSKTIGLKSKIYILYTICRQWTGGDVVNCVCYFWGKWKWWRLTIVMFSCQFGIHRQFCITATFLSTNMTTHWSSPHLPHCWQFPFQHIYVSRFQNVFLRCPTPRLHCFLSSHWPSFRFLSFMTFLIPSIQFFFGLPRALFCFGIHFSAILGNPLPAYSLIFPYSVTGNNPQ